MLPIRALTTTLQRLGQEHLGQDGPGVFSVSDVWAAVPQLSRHALTVLLGRAVIAGTLTRVCHGIYCLPTEIPRGLVLYHAASRLRADAFNYLSLESALSDAGVISQVPLNWITVMSSGRTHTVACGHFGTIEFVHTKKRPGAVASELTYDPQCRMWRASVNLALRDMKAARRNLDLVNWEVAHEPV